MIVDSHAHLVPPDLLAAIPKAKDRFPSLRLIENGGSLAFAFDARVLQFVVRMLGTERLMLGSDMPFPIGDPEPARIVAAAGLSAEQAASVNGGLAAKLFRLPDAARIGRN
ncbi:MAG: amidohydrolase family protein [Xanthobacteraceae bacterium]|jgi:predicted TIM-barrel fold metal-dependent hydrolase